MIDKTILKKYNLHPKAYYKKNNAIILDTKEQKLVLKKKQPLPSSTLKYLKTRNFNYFPNRYDYDDDQYEIWEYQEDYKLPPEEKIKDLVNILSLLHLKTTTYQKINDDQIKEQYEKIKTELEALKIYYQELDHQINKEEYPSPSNYLLIRNISKIYSLLAFLDNALEDWYETIKKESKKREVLIHNNIDLNHIIINEKVYLISWNKAKKASPIYDLITLYKKYYNLYDMDTIFKQYERNYPLNNSEKIMFFLLISLPKKIDFQKDEYENTKTVNNLLNYIYKTDKFISPYYNSKNQVKEE